MEKIFKTCFDLGGDVAKIAVQANTAEDVSMLMGLYQLPGRKVILGMGNMGRITRLMAPYLGAEFTFAAPGEGGETAPGQFSFQQLKDLYKVIDGS